MAKTAVVIFNLGGPDRPDAVKPFLINLFMDPAIIRQPWPLRWLLAHLIAARRAPVARKNYAAIGGRSPILELTRDQAAALQAEFTAAEAVRVFVAMRHWHPLAEACATEVKAYAPERVVLLPLFPQFSTTTTGSFLTAWAKAAARAGLEVPTTTVCCYPSLPGFVAALARSTAEAVVSAAQHGRPLVLFSAHGLPRAIVARGDPYSEQVRETVAAVVARLPAGTFDHRICYQSRVGPTEWLRPYTDDEIARAGAACVPLVVVPLAFVCEHSETLVELDIDYRRLAEESGVPAFLRVAAVGTAREFIEGLARLVRHAAAATTPVVCGLETGPGTRRCPAGFGGCPLAEKAGARG